MAFTIGSYKHKNRHRHKVITPSSLNHSIIQIVNVQFRLAQTIHDFALIGVGFWLFCLLRANCDPHALKDKYLCSYFTSISVSTSIVQKVLFLSQKTPFFLWSNPIRAQMASNWPTTSLRRPHICRHELSCRSRKSLMFFCVFSLFLRFKWNKTFKWGGKVERGRNGGRWLVGLGGESYVLSLFSSCQISFLLAQ